MTKVYTKAKTFVIELPDHTVENFSNNSVVLAPKPKTKIGLIAKAQPMKRTKIVSNKPVKEDDNLHHIDKTVSTPGSTNDKQNLQKKAIKDAQPTKWFQSIRNRTKHH